MEADLFGIDNSQTEFPMDSNLELRIRNFDLSIADYLMPIFEAISNSIQSIKARFGKSQYVSKGQITVQLIKTKEELTSIIVTDNGIGFNSDNFRSFLRFDSDYKRSEGGKGIGRFMWLKAFSNVRISSTYKENNERYTRSFSFSVAANPVHDHAHSKSDMPLSTRIEFKNIKPDFKEAYQRNLEQIVNDTLSHFIHMLAADKVPQVTFIQDEVEIKLKDKWKNSLLEKREETLNEINKVYITHCKIKSRLLGENALHLCAHDRSVQKVSIGNKLGLKNGFYDPEREETYNYVGIVSSEMFDRLVLSNRSDFSKNNIVKQTIDQAVDHIKSGYLKTNYDKAIEEKSDKLREILAEKPRFAHLVQNIDEYAKKQINPSSTTKLEILKDLSNAYIEEEERIDNQLKETKEKVIKGEEIELADTAKMATKISNSALEEYIKKRKDILDLMDTLQEHQNPDKETHYLEEAIHNLICPMGKDSNDITIEQHNLWIIDDRLAYCKYFASDKAIRAYVKDSTSDLVPDILFAGCTLYKSQNDSQNVRIVEFKRPARDDYTETKNPIKQIYDYIEELKNGKIVTPRGRKITEINNNTIFHCYIVCDLTNNLRKIIDGYEFLKEHPDGRGFFGYHSKKRAYIEIIQYNALLQDAKLRNQILFDKLEEPVSSK